MEAERRHSKAGFFQLFDWNSKSKKKLFSNKAELPNTDPSKQGKQNVVKSLNYPQLLEVRGNGHGLTGKRNGDETLSSVASDDGYGTKAPGVVARLMGLDCLPTSAAPEPVATPFCDSYFLSNTSSKRYSSNHQIDYHYINNFKNERGPGNLVDRNSQKMHSQPIERFQSEMFPPKSAKHIPLSHHHRLLSPIKNPGFVQTNDFAYIVEASSKIIDQCPPLENKGKRLHFVPTSVPLGMRDVRERMEASPRASGRSEAFRRPKETVVSQYNREPSREKNHIRSGDRQSNTAPVSWERGSSSRLKNKGKPGSLAAQEKVNIHKKEGFSSSRSRMSPNPEKADDATKRSHHNQGQMTMQRSVQRRTSTSRTSAVHKQSNQKQSCVTAKEKLPPKASVPTQQNRRSPSVNGSVRPVKASSKVWNSEARSGKINTTPRDFGKVSQTKTFSERKQPDIGNLYLEDNAEESTAIDEDHNRQIKCNIADDGCSRWDAGERESAIDVVSFTFTSPIKKPHTVSGSSAQLMDNGVVYPDDISYPKNSTLYSPRSNVTGRDALSVLLEQKLEELTCRVESSGCDFDNAGSASFNSNFMDTTPNGQCINFELNLRKAKSRVYDVDSASSDGLPKAYGNWQGLQEFEGQSSVNSNSVNSYSDYRKERNNRYANLMPTLETLSSDRSYDSPDLNSASIANSSKRIQLINHHGMVDSISNGVSRSSGVELDFPDSASCSSVAYASEDCNSPTIGVVENQRPANWELEYIIKILCNSDLILEDLVFGQVNEVLNQSLFDHLENLQTVSAENAEENFKLERKILFDCIGEYLNLKGEDLLGGKCKALSNWGTLLGKKEVLAEDLHKDFSNWTSIGEVMVESIGEVMVESIGEVMVDELVDKDMSSGKGKWVDFETEESENGVEIEKMILSSLIHELVADFLLK